MREPERLIEKYLEGATSGKEERRLQQLIANGTTGCDEDEAWLAALFQYEEEERQLDKEERQQQKEKVRQHEEEQQQRADRARIKMRTALAVAATVAALVLFATVWQLATPQQNYAYIDGEKTTDQQVIEAEALEALDIVSASDEETFEALF